MNSTLNYYEQHAQRFIQDTLDKQMHIQYQMLEPYLAKDAHILDAGCGSGRDSLYFKSRGYPITAFDASQKMCEFATELLGQEVLLLNFEDLKYYNTFDAIWASASLLHISKNQMPDILNKLSNALKPDGVLYASFKYGDDEYIKDGRCFNSYTKESFQQLLQGSQLECIQTLVLQDTRQGKENEYWLNVICHNKKTT